MSLLSYNTIFLDCDGVILDSNRVKRDAFREALATYPEEQIERFIDYHRAFGGISRYEKVEYFLREIVGRYNRTEFESILARFGAHCTQKLADADFTVGARRFIQLASESAALYVVSGGDQAELITLFKQNGWAKYFEQICGSPVAKGEHLARLFRNGKVNVPALFVGDSPLDHQVAIANGLDFIFLNGYTDYKSWHTYCKENKVNTYSDFEEYLSVHSS